MARTNARGRGKRGGAKKKAAGAPPPGGQLRQSQVVTTFGPGSMVDLPEHAMVIGGLDHWYGKGEPIYEERLAAKVAKVLGVSDISMHAPPVDTQDPLAPRTGITAFRFPEWFIAQAEVERDGVRSRPLVHWNALHKRRFTTDDRDKVEVVPVRFVQACPNGHISDIDWHGFVHRDFKDPCRGQLWFDEGGTSGELAELVVRCEACRRRRPLSDAKLPKSRVLGGCLGSRPWLGRYAKEQCVDTATGKRHYNRLLIRSASNAYFSQTLSVIHIPDQSAPLREAIDRVWEDFLKYAEEVDDIRRERRKERVKNAIAEFSDAEVWAEVQRRRRGTGGDDSDETSGVSIKRAEIETLLSADELGEDKPDGDFYARARSLEDLPPQLEPLIERIVLVHRLREVTAQVGFTRFEAAMTDIEGELDLDVQRGALSIEPEWVPAIENRGEGVFIAFRPEVMQAWWRRRVVKDRLQKLERGFLAWARSRGLTLKWPGGPYVMLHTLSHLLVTAVSLDCGYSASSIRERVYAGSSGYGILLHTGTSGSEGTLGGLIEVGRRIEHHLLRALELGRLCSNDPVCATHEPDNPFEERFLHGAACHGCVLIAETSCERRNELLDRALVVPTVVTPDAAFFGGIETTPAGIQSAPPRPARRSAKPKARAVEPERRLVPRRNAAPAEAAKPEADSLDLEDFDEPWWPLIKQLAARDGVRVELGGDVSKRGRVVGVTFAELRNDDTDRALFLIDGDEPEAAKVAAALAEKKLRGLVIKPDEATIETVLAALRGDG